MHYIYWCGSILRLGLDRQSFAIQDAPKVGATVSRTGLRAPSQSPQSSVTTTFDHNLISENPSKPSFGMDSRAHKRAHIKVLIIVSGNTRWCCLGLGLGLARLTELNGWRGQVHNDADEHGPKDRT